MTAALRFAGFGFTYAGAATPAIDGVSLEVPGGEVVSVITAQGRGKTTLMRAAAGLLGEIYQGEVRGSVERRAAMRPGAFFDGYVQVTLAVETVAEEIALPLYASAMERPARESRVREIARELRIDHLLDRDVTALSGGEEKLVGIAAALIPDTDVYVLDEPFEQLDVPHFSAVIRALKRRARAGRLVLVSCGSVDTALNVADGAIVGADGRWRYVARPSYTDVALADGVGESSLGRLLVRRHVDPAAVRRFRDAVVMPRPSPVIPSAARDLHVPIEVQIPRFARDDTLLEVRDVSYAYPGGKPVLAGASLAVASHMVCGILGPNGAGKSTLARLAAGVFQPTTGTVTVAGKNLADVDGPRRAAVVRVTFQTPEHELFRPTLGDELDWEARLLKADAAEMRRRAEAALERCEAKVPLDKHPYDLDPWQRKLFACVSALAIPNRLVILDEPTLRLGQRVRARLGEAIQAYAAEGGAVVFVTHDHEFAAAICQTIAVVKRGKIEASGPAATVLADAAGHAATNIYSFPSYFLDQAVRRRSQLPAINSRGSQV